MDTVRGPRLAWTALIAATLIAAPATAQPGLEARMRAFTHAIERQTIDSVAAFFPRRGTWTWVLTTHTGLRGDRVGMWRFGAEQTLRALDEGGPVCESFEARGEVGSVGVLVAQMGYDPPRPWRRARGNRFVPRGASAGSPHFVQWRREDGRWVVSAFGDERWLAPRLLGSDRNVGMRDRITGEPLTIPIPPDGPHAGRMGWFLRHEPIVFDDRHFYKYGLPRTLAPGDVTRAGALDGVGIYAETGQTGLPDVLYVPVGPGFEFQPYHPFGEPPCYDPGVPGDGE